VYFDASTTHSYRCVSKTSAITVIVSSRLPRLAVGRAVGASDLPAQVKRAMNGGDTGAPSTHNAHLCIRARLLVVPKTGRSPG
jgi:hypothetical protein